MVHGSQTTDDSQKPGWIYYKWSGLIITHRLSSIIDADMIFLLENGNVIEAGNHEKLIGLGKKYNSFYKQQASSLI
ncbi:MAG: hypothetical protein HC905_17175 [Bacteroidales bacterium]|nr:hypothetical protein [Bacteroidales bacterium]